MEMSVTEQRYRALLEQAGLPVTEVADRFGVSRQAVHRWLPTTTPTQPGMAG